MTQPESIKIIIHTQRRRDGGLRVWSDDVPGLILSHADADRVMADIIPAVETIMEDVLGYPIRASQLIPVSGRVVPTRRAPSILRRVRTWVGQLADAREGVLEYAAARAPCIA